MDKYAYIILYMITAFFGILNYKKYWHNKTLRYWFIFVLYSFSNEIINRYIIDVLHIRVYTLNNLWFIANNIFYMLFFLNLINSKRQKGIVKILLGVFLLYFSVSAVFYKDLTKDYFVDTFIVGQLCVVFSIMVFYLDLLNSDRILHFKKSMFFYISIGVLVFNICLLPVYVIAELINWQGIFRHIILGVNVVLNACFVLGFIRSKKEYNI